MRPASWLLAFCVNQGPAMQPADSLHCPPLSSSLQAGCTTHITMHVAVPRPCELSCSLPAGGTIALYSLLCRELRVGFNYRTRSSEAALSKASLSRHSLQRSGGTPHSPAHPDQGSWLRRKLEVRLSDKKILSTKLRGKVSNILGWSARLHNPPKAAGCAASLRCACPINRHETRAACGVQPQDALLRGRPQQGLPVSPLPAALGWHPTLACASCPRQLAAPQAGAPGPILSTDPYSRCRL